MHTGDSPALLVVMRETIFTEWENAMEYIENLENKLDSQEHEIEMIKNQIQIMWEYIGHLEDAEKELQRMLNKYHDDDCNVCDRAYMAHDNTQFHKGVFRGAAISANEKGNWVFQDVKTKPLTK